MERYIDADKYKADLLVGQEYLDEDTLLTAVNLLDCQPTADRHGRWIGKKYDWDNEYNPPKIKDSHYLVCSICGYKHPIYNYNVWTNTLTRGVVIGEKSVIPNYCSNCGVEMEREKD